MWLISRTLDTIVGYDDASIIDNDSWWNWHLFSTCQRCHQMLRHKVKTVKCLNPYRTELNRTQNRHYKNWTRTETKFSMLAKNSNRTEPYFWLNPNRIEPQQTDLGLNCTLRQLKPQIEYLSLLSRRWRQRERLSGSVLSICLFVCLSVCRQNAKKTLFSQKLSNL